jgi:hypothetical protein
LLAPRVTTKLEDHPLSAVRDCLFNIFAATLHIGGRSSIRNLRTRNALVTGTDLIKYFLFPSGINEAVCTLMWFNEQFLVHHHHHHYHHVPEGLSVFPVL